MTQTLWNPWSAEYNDLFTTWMKAAKLAGIIAGEFTWDMDDDYDEIVARDNV